MAGESSSKKPKTMTAAEWLDAQREEKENQRQGFFNQLLRQEAQLAQAVFDAFNEEGLGGDSTQKPLSPRKTSQ